MQRLPSVLFCILGFSLLSAESCETHLIDDSGFDLWCGDALCNWDLEKGSVQRTASWHSADHAAELVGDDVILSQRSSKGSGDATCLRFEMVADVDENARLTLEIDYYDDGIVDYQQEVGRVAWKPIVYMISTPPRWRGARFRLRKNGAGRVRLAQIEAIAADDCVDPPAPPQSLPSGAQCWLAGCWGEDCWEGASCVGGFCTDATNGPDNNTCGGCAEDADCEGALVCGTVDPANPFLAPYRACIAEASRNFGESCVGNGECATGICCGGRCSTCCEGEDCQLEGESCVQAQSLETVPESHLPWICRASAGNPPGGACLSGADCASAQCDGGESLALCSVDGRSCTGEEQCPMNELEPESLCVSLGVYGGQCL